jgi:hypothetical protein
MATDAGRTGLVRSRARRLTTETKASWKTTELYVTVAVVVGILIAAAVVDETDTGGFGARQAWLYVTIAVVGYVISRGLAKSGSRDPYWDDADHDHDRVTTRDRDIP